jgi:hypothetical protein
MCFAIAKRMYAAVSRDEANSLCLQKGNPAAVMAIGDVSLFIVIVIPEGNWIKLLSEGQHVWHVHLFPPHHTGVSSRVLS